MPKPDQPRAPRPFRSPHDALEEWQFRVETLNDPGTRVCRRCVPDHHLWEEAAAGAHDARDTAESDCALCRAAVGTVSFEDLAVVVERVIGELYVTVEESGSYHDDGEWSQRVEDVADLAQELLYGAVDDGVLAPLGAFVADPTPSTTASSASATCGRACTTSTRASGGTSWPAPEQATSPRVPKLCSRTCPTTRSSCFGGSSRQRSSTACSSRRPPARPPRRTWGTEGF
jgi:hypothetical protein